MNICLFTTDYPPMLGGIAAHSARLAAALARMGNVKSARVIALNNRVNDTVCSGTLVVHRDSGRSLIRLFVQTVYWALVARRSDVFHALTVFPIGFFLVFIGKYLLQVPVVVTVYGTDVLTSEGSALTQWAKRFVLRHASRVIAFSHSTRDLVMRKYQLEQCPPAVVYTPLEVPACPSANDIEAARLRAGVGEDDFVVLFVGNLVRRKGAELLVQALARIDDKRVVLVIVGDGPERNMITRRVTELGLGKRVVLVGKVEAAPYFALAHVFSMPSFFDHDSDDVEGLGIVYLEAQAYGIPVIGTRSGGIPEAIDAGASGFIVEEKDVEGIARHICELKNDASLRAQMGARGKIFVTEKFDWRHSAAEHTDIYKSLCTV